jgi:hypothetical protein
LGIDDVHIKRVENFDIHSKWKKLIVESWKSDANLVEDPEDIPYVLGIWNWIRSRPDTIMETIKILTMRPAVTINTMITVKMVLDDIKYDIEKKDEIKLRMRFSRSLQIMGMCNLVDSVELSPQEVGKGKRTVTIYLSPFATREDFEECRQSYLKIGGRLGERKSRGKKTLEEYEDSAEREIVYREIVKRKTFLNKVKRMEKMGFYFYECPRCGSVIKISQNDEDLYKMIKGKLFEPCNCGHEFMERVMA